MARVAFVQRNLNENLAFMYLSACLKRAGHDCDCFIEVEEKNLKQKIQDFKPDIIAFTVISGMYRWAIETAEKIKSPGSLVVFGGPHPTFFPEVLNEDVVDVVCVGEGEDAFVELADSVEVAGKYL